MTSYKKWNASEIQFIQENMGISTDDQIAAKLSQITGQNITYGMVRRQRRKMGVIKKRGRPRKNRDVSVS